MTVQERPSLEDARSRLEALEADKLELQDELSARQKAFDEAKGKGATLAELTEFMAKKDAVASIVAQHQMELDAQRRTVEDLEDQVGQETLKSAYVDARSAYGRAVATWRTGAAGMVATLAQNAQGLAEVEKEAEAAWWTLRAATQALDMKEPYLEGLGFGEAIHASGYGDHYHQQLALPGRVIVQLAKR
jgi:hypothetical protein